MTQTHIGSFNIQKYNPGGHFAEVHSERTSLTKLHRILVWMTYLNDVEEAGETEFVHYGLRSDPARANIDLASRMDTCPPGQPHDVGDKIHYHRVVQSGGVI